MDVFVRRFQRDDTLPYVLTDPFPRGQTLLRIGTGAPGQRPFNWSDAPIRYHDRRAH